MSDQELDYHVCKLEDFFNAAPLSKRQRMTPGIQTMIRSLKAKNKRLPLSLERMERQLKREGEADIFDNVPV